MVDWAVLWARMWDKLALLPFSMQSLVCPSRTSELILLGLLFWICGFFCGGLLAALVLSPGLRRGIARLLVFVLHEHTPPVNTRASRLQRYLD